MAQPFNVIGRHLPWLDLQAAGAAPEAEHRVCTAFIGLAAGAWPQAERLNADTSYQWSDFDPKLVDAVRRGFPDLPPAAVATALRIWGHLHGLVSLEIYGHLRGQTSNPNKLYRDEIAHLIRSLGLTPPDHLSPRRR